MADMTLKDVQRFDTSKAAIPMKWYLRPVTWILSFPVIWLQPSKLRKVNMDGVKAPYLILANHNAFFDFMAMVAVLFPKPYVNIVAIDGFIKREWLLRAVGCVGKRKFTNDPVLVRQLIKLIKKQEIIALYPEARYSLCGTNAILPESLGKLIKLLKVPVATFITKGHHINSPFWNLKKRGNRTEADLKLILTKEQIESMTSEEINSLIDTEFKYDDFAWQYENKVKVTYKKRAEGLHKVLYQCPNCKVEYMMDSKGVEIFCNNCNRRWSMTEYGQLEALEGATEFPHIPNWYEWQRQQVKEEIEKGIYYFDMPVRIDSLPNAKGYVDLGMGRLVHDMTGFTLEGISDNEPFVMKWPAKSNYSVHIEYNYLGKHGDCIDLNTLNDTLYIYPQVSKEAPSFSVTKLSLATEELYKLLNKKGIYNT